MKNTVYTYFHTYVKMLQILPATSFRMSWLDNQLHWSRFSTSVLPDKCWDSNL